MKAILKRLCLGVLRVIIACFVLPILLLASMIFYTVSPVYWVLTGKKMIDPVELVIDFLERTKLSKVFYD